MRQEAEPERGRSPNPGQAGAQRAAKAVEIEGAVIRELSGLHVAPERLDRIQFGRIGGQPLGPEPGAVRREVGPHAAAGVGAEAVPEENDALPSEVPLERAQERDQRRCGVRPRASLEVQPSAPAVPAKRQGGGARQASPVVDHVPQDGGLTARRPGPPDDRLLGEAAFVLEDEPGALAPGVFFTAGHRTRTHRRMAASSRSTAWRAERWSDQFRRCRIRQT